mmetsp:Transcript_22440/g.60686  ORF Transcript_22440/g.60686 Transcript_22440/m.60686 type:complete len:205 (+) Transcript_22440:37-651(+)
MLGLPVHSNSLVCVRRRHNVAPAHVVGVHLFGARAPELGQAATRHVESHKEGAHPGEKGHETAEDGSHGIRRLSQDAGAHDTRMHSVREHPAAAHGGESTGAEASVKLHGERELGKLGDTVALHELPRCVQVCGRRQPVHRSTGSACSINAVAASSVHLVLGPAHPSLVHWRTPDGARAHVHDARRTRSGQVGAPANRREQGEC